MQNPVWLVAAALTGSILEPAAAQLAASTPPPACLTVQQSTRIEPFTHNIWPVIVIANGCNAPYAMSWCRQISLPGATPKLGECADTTGGYVEVLAGPNRAAPYVLPSQTIQMDAWPMETAYLACVAKPPGPGAATGARRLGPYELSSSCPLSPSGRFAAWADPALKSRWREDTSTPGRWVYAPERTPVRKQALDD